VKPPLLVRRSSVSTRPAAPGGVVRILERLFGTATLEVWAFNWESSPSSVPLEVVLWRDTRIDVRLPADMRTGDWVIAISPAGWDDSRVAVGHVSVKKSGDEFYRCWKFRRSSYQGAVLFDLRPLIEASRSSPSKAELLFDLDNSGGFDWDPLAHAPHSCGIIWVFEASEAW